VSYVGNRHRRRNGLVTIAVPAGELGRERNMHEPGTHAAA